MADYIIENNRYRPEKTTNLTAGRNIVGLGDYGDNRYIPTLVADATSPQTEWIIRFKEGSKSPGDLIEAWYDEGNTPVSTKMTYTNNYANIYKLPYTFSPNTNDYIYTFDGNKRYIMKHITSRHLFIAEGTGIAFNHTAVLAGFDQGCTIQFGKTVSQAWSDIGPDGEGIGDPYIKPLLGPLYKLPDKKCIYRLFENDDIYINGSVSKMTVSNKLDLIEHFLTNGHNTDNVDNLILDGYFFDLFYINSENNYIKIDINTGDVFMNNADYYSFDLEKKYEKRELIGADFTDIFKISWEHSKYGKQQINIKFYENPQVNNGIEIKTKLIKNSIGSLVRNYNPILMEIPNLNTLQYEDIHDNIKNAKEKFITTKIKDENEKWVRIKQN